MSHDFNQLRELFLAAVDRCPFGQYDAYLDEMCGQDQGLRRAVAELLQAHMEGGGVRTGIYQSAGETASAVIGPYKLLEPIGEGGMGTVWMAQQQEPVRRKVALKLIKAGMDSKQVVARFEAERQALALMDHPNIAKVLDGGTTDTGLPYFVMELVKGVPITKYCDESRLTPRQRLELFLPVCQAVQHAHSKGVIHRDLKPSNVLVALYDGKPVPKVIDFGVAKAVGVELTDKTLFTNFGAVVGTLEYMSPEQAELNNLDIDTRSDVYSLGVMLYELLTSTTPLESNRLKATSLLEALRLIREEEPLTPSTRLSTAKELPAIAASRGVEQRHLSGLVRGEVDWIVMKCLEKDRSRRYDTANGLARDLERYLNDEPVLACPPSAGYRLRKFARRNRAALAMIGVVIAGLLLTVVGLAVSTLFIWQAKNEAVQALDREQRSSYWQRVALAERELASNNLRSCLALLGQCPERYRGWEWHYLGRAGGKALPPMRHDNALYRMAVSPDGKRLVCPDSGGSVTVWDVASGARLMRIPGHAKKFADRVAFSPDGRHFVTTNYDPSQKIRCEVKVWDVHTYAQVASWLSLASGAGAIVFSPDGRLACSFFNDGEDGTTDLRDPFTGKVVRPLGVAKQGTVDLAFTRDGRLLAEVTNGQEARLWDVTSGKAVWSVTLPQKPNALALSGDGRLVAVGFGQEGEQDGRVRIWETDTGHERPPLVGQQVWSIEFSPDGSRLATGGSDQAVKLWDVQSGKEILTLRGHQDLVIDLLFTPDGHRLISAGNDGEVRIWDGRPLADGEQIGEELFTLRGHTSGVRAVAWSPREPTLVTGGFDGLVKLWDPQTGRESRSPPTGLTNVEAVAFSPDGKLMAVGGRPGSSVLVLDTATWKVTHRLPTPSDAVQSLAFRPDGKHLAIGCNTGVVHVRAVGSEDEVGRLSGHRWGIYDLAYGPGAGGHWLATTDSVAHTVRLWDARTLKEHHGVPLRHQGFTCGLAFSPTEALLASVGWDRMVRLWDTKTWKQVDARRDLTGAVQGVAFSPDGRLVAWASTDSTVKVWHRPSGEVATLRGHTDFVSRVAFSPDGTRIASASQDGTAKVWETPKFQ